MTEFDPSKTPATKAETARCLEDMVELLKSRAWQMFAARLQAMKDADIEKCIINETPHDAAKAAGRIWAFRTMLDWPFQMAKECKIALDDPNRAWDYEPSEHDLPPE